VRDTGRGIPPQSMATLYEPFRRRQKQGEYAFSGSGLGLSICRKLVEAMGSTLEVETAPGYRYPLSTSCWTCRWPESPSSGRAPVRPGRRGARTSYSLRKISARSEVGGRRPTRTGTLRPAAGPARSGSGYRSPGRSPPPGSSHASTSFRQMDRPSPDPEKALLALLLTPAKRLVERRHRTAADPSTRVATENSHAPLEVCRAVTSTNPSR